MHDGRHDAFEVSGQPVSALRRLTDNALARHLAILASLAAVWQAYALYLNNPLMLPTFTDTAAAFYEQMVGGRLAERAWVSLRVLSLGYALGVLLAALLAGLATLTRLGDDLLTTLTAMFNPLPAIALLPLALLWLGIGTPSLIFVLVHAVLWPLALNAHAGFSGISETLRMAGRNYGLRGWRYLVLLFVPAAFPSILTGLKIAWAFAWRTLIAAELVFGVSSGSGGLGWFIFENKNRLEIANVFAGLATVIIIGLLVENLVFRTIERHTVRKWGMQR